ncbi:MAG: universal stress protein [Chlorobiaceae bacterium]|nr:universal stress protein [Chlorobiaceae bacterium]NTV61665.1 universal stress protein [Chlorobiaceae bacterium]
MIHLGKILCPTDFSPTSDNAVSYAVEFARKVGAHVRFLNIITPNNPKQQAESTDVPEIHDSVQEDEGIPENFSKVLMAEKKKGLSADIFFLKGDEAHRIISEHAASWGADLIIMGSHGRTGITRLIMGSVAEEVFRSSGVPVLLVKVQAAEKIVSE